MTCDMKLCFQFACFVVPIPDLEIQGVSVQFMFWEDQRDEKVSSVTNKLDYIFYMTAFYVTVFYVTLGSGLHFMYMTVFYETVSWGLHFTWPFFMWL